MPEPRLSAPRFRFTPDLSFEQLKRTRWPLSAGNDDWYYGVDRAYLEELVDYWLLTYDWRQAETAIKRSIHR